MTIPQLIAADNNCLDINDKKKRMSKTIIIMESKRKAKWDLNLFPIKTA